MYPVLSFLIYEWHSLCKLKIASVNAFSAVSDPWTSDPAHFAKLLIDEHVL